MPPPEHGRAVTAVDPYDHGWLDVGDDNQMYWEVRGNRSGRTVLIVHGGPGSGRSRTAHEGFDHDVFQVVSFDQRGCGDSTLSAADPATDEQWHRFRGGAPEHLRDGNLVEAYRQLVNDPDPEIRGLAARAWCAWEDAAIAHETRGRRGQYSAKSDTAKLALVRICTHYFAEHAWLADGQLLRDAHRLHGIPGILIHGRLDLSAPLLTAWELADAWPDAELIVVDDAGHTGSPTMRTTIEQAISRFTHGDLCPSRR